MKKYTWIYAVSLIASISCAGCGGGGGSDTTEPTDTTTTQNAVCGNGAVEKDEQCDDSNSNGGDGCSEDCRQEENYTCAVAGQPCKANSDVEKDCGNSEIDSGEGCDDGNRESGDGCSADCKIEKNYECPTPGEKCIESTQVQNSVCGDGKLEGKEVCDDHNTNSGDGCAADCMTIEPGYYCTKEGEACESKCGDNYKTDDEACDDYVYPGRSPISGDGCSDECKIEPHFICENDSNYHTSLCYPERCGDGVVQKDLSEECDSFINQKDYGYDEEKGQPYCTKKCTFSVYCGDGIKQEEFGEECDKGMINDAGLPVGGDNAYGSCTDDCKLAAYCGDGTKDPEEACDDGNTKNGDGCAANCQAVEQGWRCSIIDGTCERLPCGNGELNVGEHCDDGNFVAGDGCFYCRAEEGYKCIQSPNPCSDCTESEQCKRIEDLYGDGVIDPDGYEECDDGNNIDGDGCTKGKIDSGYICPTANQLCVAKACGDGIVARGEDCDDGNLISGDGCSVRCRIEENYRCDNSSGKSVCIEGYCGDGIVQTGEECDAAVDEIPGVGCSANCKIDPGYECKKDGGACQSITCGDGELAPSDGYNTYKTCDDNNAINGDGCSSECRIETGYHCDNSTGVSICSQGQCGDGVLDVGEECDDDNKEAGDGCSPTCKKEAMIECENGVCKPICGDGITLWDMGEYSEECDDGNLIAGDGCSPDCKKEIGFNCTTYSNTYPPSIQLQAVFHDFRAYGDYTSGNTNYHTNSCTDVTNSNPKDGCINEKMAVQYGANFKGKHGHPDFQNVNANEKDIVKSTLGADGLPVFNKANTKKITKTSFDMWYRDVPGINKTINGSLTLNLTNANTGTYVLNSSAFFPIDHEGYGPEGTNVAHNYHFTTYIKCSIFK